MTLHPATGCQRPAARDEWSLSHWCCVGWHGRNPTVAFNAAAAEELDTVGHVCLPRLLTNEVIERLIESLDHIDKLNRHHQGEGQRLRQEAEAAGQLEEFQKRMQGRRQYGPGAISAEHDTFLEATIGHPQMLELARAVLGQEIRYDHQVSLIKHGGHQGQQWHTHQYASGARCASSGNDDEGLSAVATNPISEDLPDLGFIRIFCEHMCLCCCVLIVDVADRCA